jgi:hypothetical protein
MEEIKWRDYRETDEENILHSLQDVVIVADGQVRMWTEYSDVSSAAILHKIVKDFVDSTEPGNKELNIKVIRHHTALILRNGKVVIY